MKLKPKKEGDKKVRLPINIEVALTSDWAAVLSIFGAAAALALGWRTSAWEVCGAVAGIVAVIALVSFFLAWRNG